MLHLYYQAESTGGRCSALLGQSSPIAGSSPGPLNSWAKTDPSSSLEGIPPHQSGTSIRYKSGFKSTMRADSESLVQAVERTEALDVVVSRAGSVS